MNHLLELTLTQARSDIRRAHHHEKEGLFTTSCNRGIFSGEDSDRRSSFGHAETDL